MDARCPTSLLEWAAVKVIRSRAEPRATVGKRMAGIKNPLSRNFDATSTALVSFPTKIGMIKLSGDAIPTPAESAECSRRFAKSHALLLRSLPSVDCTILIAALAAAAAAGTGAVEKMKLRARFTRKS